MKQHGPSRPQTILLVLGGILILILLMITGFHILTRPAEPAAVPAFSAPGAANSLPSARNPANTALLGFSDSRASGPTHILLIGQDRREGESRARADAIILCSFLPEENRLVLTSILRDLYVDIPGRQPDRINAAYAYGGIPLLQQTIEENFDLPVSGCLEVDFSRFSQVIDALGGVTIELRQDEADAINDAVPGTLTEGPQLLSGDQALAYTRIRNLDRDGDFSRTNRQRNVLNALLNRFQDASLLSLLSTAMEILPMISTDMEQQHFMQLAMELFPMLSGADISSQRIPADGTFSYSTVRGMSVLEADMDAARASLSKSFYPADPSSSAAEP